MKLVVSLCIIILFVQFSSGQEFFSVIAENGLILRSKPNRTSKRIGKLLCGEDIQLLQKTNIKLTITDHNTELNGYWYLIESSSKGKGYVFSGYLLEKKESSQYRALCDDEYGTCDTTIIQPNFDLTIYDYQLEGKHKKKDTLVLYEEVFNEIGDKLVRIKPKNNCKEIRVSYTYIEALNPWVHKKENEKIIQWKGHQPLRSLNRHAQYFYRIPITAYEEIRETRAKKMKLKRDPNWDHVGEGWWFPRYEYQGKIVPYEITSFIIHIEMTLSNGTSEYQTIEILLSYGC